MPEYLSPGVYVEEVDTGNKPIEGVATSTAGFVGITERGPVAATLVTSFSEFVRTFGRYVKDGASDRYLAYAVEGFFQNGGKRCFIMRVVSGNKNSPALPAKATLDGMTVNANGPGTWASGRLAVKVSKAGVDLVDSTLFRLTVLYWDSSVQFPSDPTDATKKNVIIVDPTDPSIVASADLTDPKKANATILDLTNAKYKDIVDPSSDPTHPQASAAYRRQATLIEVFDNLSGDPTSNSFYELMVNDSSNLVQLSHTATGRPKDTLTLLSGGDNGAAIEPVDFQGDPLAEPGHKTGLAAFEEVDEIAILVCPDANDYKGVTGSLIDQCENLKDRFAITSSKQAADPVAKHRPPRASKYAAYYYPWIEITNPVTGLTQVIPPDGHIAGIYARSDIERGVHKAPANEVIRGIQDLQLQITKGQQDILNPRGVNALRYFPGRGNLVWGARTTTLDPDWKYVNVRRLFIYVEKSIEEATQWVVFEPNDEPLWARVRRSVSAFLTGLWRDGMLQGHTREEAYFVKCDRTTMTQADIDNGKLIMLIGIAPVKPAEFVIFRIGQWTGGSDVTEG